MMYDSDGPCGSIGGGNSELIIQKKGGKMKKDADGPGGAVGGAGLI